MGNETTTATTKKMGFALETTDYLPPIEGRCPVSVTWLWFRWLDRRGKVCEVAMQATEDADFAAMDLEAMGRRVREMVREHGREGDGRRC